MDLLATCGWMTVLQTESSCSLRERVCATFTVDRFTPRNFCCFGWWQWWCLFSTMQLCFRVSCAQGCDSWQSMYPNWWPNWFLFHRSGLQPCCCSTCLSGASLHLRYEKLAVGSVQNVHAYALESSTLESYTAGCCKRHEVCEGKSWCKGWITSKSLSSWMWFWLFSSCWSSFEWRCQGHSATESKSWSPSKWTWTILGAFTASHYNIYWERYSILTNSVYRGERDCGRKLYFGMIMLLLVEGTRLRASRCSNVIICFSSFFSPHSAYKAR